MLSKFKASRHPIRCIHLVTCRACAQKSGYTSYNSVCLSSVPLAQRRDICLYSVLLVTHARDHGKCFTSMVKERLRLKFTSNLPHCIRRLKLFCQTCLPEFMWSDSHACFGCLAWLADSHFMCIQILIYMHIFIHLHIQQLISRELSDCREGTGLKTVFVLFCGGNLQHI